MNIVLSSLAFFSFHSFSFHFGLLLFSHLSFESKWVLIKCIFDWMRWNVLLIDFASLTSVRLNACRKCFWRKNQINLNSIQSMIFFELTLNVFFLLLFVKQRTLNTLIIIMTVNIFFFIFFKSIFNETQVLCIHVKQVEVMSKNHKLP